MPAGHLGTRTALHTDRWPPEVAALRPCCPCVCVCVCVFAFVVFHFFGVGHFSNVPRFSVLGSDISGSFPGFRFLGVGHFWEFPVFRLFGVRHVWVCSFFFVRFGVGHFWDFTCCMCFSFFWGGAFLGFPRFSSFGGGTLLECSPFLVLLLFFSFLGRDITGTFLGFPPFVFGFLGWDISGIFPVLQFFLGLGHFWEFPRFFSPVFWQYFRKLKKKVDPLSTVVSRCPKQ